MKVIYLFQSVRLLLFPSHLLYKLRYKSLFEHNSKMFIAILETTD